MFVIEFSHQIHGATTYFTLSNKFKNQREDIVEANELSNQIDEFSAGESGYEFESITKVTVKKFRYQ